jgi:hypothetical protein
LFRVYFTPYILLYNFYLHDVNLLEILVSISSIGYYHIFALNLRDSHIFILDLITTGIINKEDRVKRFSHALKQINRNITRVVRLKHSNYEGKRDSIASQIMFLLLLGNVAAMLIFDLFPIF